MTLPTIDGLHHVGCHCNDICACSDPIECIHEQCICDRLSAAYKRGREDATKAIEELFNVGGGGGLLVGKDTAIAAASGECEHRFVMHYADKAGQCDKCGAIDTEVWHEGGILEQMYDEANKEEQ